MYTAGMPGMMGQLGGGMGLGAIGTGAGMGAMIGGGAGGMAPMNAMGMIGGGAGMGGMPMNAMGMMGGGGMNPMGMMSGGGMAPMNAMGMGGAGGVNPMQMGGMMAGGGGGIMGGLMAGAGRGGGPGGPNGAGAENTPWYRPPPSETLYLGDLRDYITREEVVAAFQHMPGYIATRVRNDKFGHVVAFVEFSTVQGAADARDAFGGSLRLRPNDPLVSIHFARPSMPLEALPPPGTGALAKRQREEGALRMMGGGGGGGGGGMGGGGMGGGGGGGGMMQQQYGDGGPPSKYMRGGGGGGGVGGGGGGFNPNDIAVGPPRSSGGGMSAQQLLAAQAQAPGGAHDPQPPGPVLFVDRVPGDASEREIAHLFRPFIGYVSCRVVPRGRGLPLVFVDFESTEAAAAAKEGMSGYKFDPADAGDAGITIQFAKPRGGGGGGGGMMPMHGGGMAAMQQQQPFVLQQQQQQLQLQQLQQQQQPQQPQGAFFTPQAMGLGLPQPQLLPMGDGTGGGVMGGGGLDMGSSGAMAGGLAFGQQLQQQPLPPQLAHGLQSFGGSGAGQAAVPPLVQPPLELAQAAAGAGGDGQQQQQQQPALEPSAGDGGAPPEAPTVFGDTATDAATVLGGGVAWPEPASAAAPAAAAAGGV